MDEQRFPGAYDPKEHEEEILARWDTAVLGTPPAKAPKDDSGRFSMVLPPPNVTGTLHLGHAVMLAIEDLMVRFARLSGKDTVWIPGTDHAAIATENKVEGLLRKEGIEDPRKTLGREAFLARVHTFAAESASTILHQVKRMGSSIDWTRLAYTLDKPRNQAVVEMFRRLYEDGLIERGYRVVNWDPAFQTTLSDDEVETKVVSAKLLTFRYAADFPISIATTRPETKFGDTAVAVHPEDPRYKAYIGQTFTPSFLGTQLTIRVIADEAVDPNFGTGALGVTPAHSLIDAEMAERHGLEMVAVIDQKGCMNERTGSFAGLSIAEARKQITQQLQEAGLLEEVKDVEQNLPVAQRGGGIVENLPLRQWFIRVNKPFAVRQHSLKRADGSWFKKQGETTTLKELMREAILSGSTRIVPERFEKTYFHWVDHLRDWCISRQIWFGHQVPVWYRGDEMKVGESSPGEGWVQDEDSLDTWFSSGMWTFSTLGWPDAAFVNETGELIKKPGSDLERFHPTSVLETGYDILPFWVARMLLMSTYALGEVPFKTVYLHGLVRDEHGQKMSKSLGNVIDPLEMVEAYGADATRLALVLGSTPGNDMRLSTEKIAGFKNFTNKLWNISRFILTGTQTAGSIDLASVQPTTRPQRWILSRFVQTSEAVTQMLLRHDYSLAGETLREFTWGEFADWYIEISKVEKKRDESTKASSERTLLFILERLLVLWHPFMPFVTEAIWQKSGFSTDLLARAAWSELKGAFQDRDDQEAALQIDLLKQLVTEVRAKRAAAKVLPKDFVTLCVETKQVELLQAETDWVAQLSRAQLQINAGSLPDSSDLIGPYTYSLALPDSTAPALNSEEHERLYQETFTYLEKLNTDLANPTFLERAPAHVVASLREKQLQTKERLELLSQQRPL